MNEIPQFAPRQIAPHRKDRRMGIKTIERLANLFMETAKKERIHVSYSAGRFTHRVPRNSGRMVLHSTVGYYDKNATVDMIIEDMADELAKDCVRITGK